MLMRINAPARSLNGNVGNAFSEQRRKMVRNGKREKRRPSALISFSFVLLFFVFFVCFVRSSFAQSNLDPLTQKIKSGSVEEKREALFQIRNLRSEAASQIAIPALRDSNDIVRATAASSVI